jgi:hypothetical protein
MRRFTALLLVAVLTACGGGGSNDYPERVDRTIGLVNRNAAILTELDGVTDPVVRAPLVAEFNANITLANDLKALGGSESEDCGTGRYNNGNAAERLECHAKWDRALTPLTP